MSELADLQEDVVAELFNMGIGSATDALNKMVGEEVSLSAPKVIFLSRRKAAKQISEQGGTRISGVQEEFSGAFWGTALLIFPKDKSLDLVCALMQQNAPMAEFTSLEEEVLVEVGNVIINACLGTLSDVLGDEINTTVPSFLHGDCDSVLAGTADADDTVLQLHIDFALKDQDIQGFFVLRVDVGSVESLVARIEECMLGL